MVPTFKQHILGVLNVGGSHACTANHVHPVRLGWVNVRSFSDCYVLNVGGSQYVRVVTSPLPTENK
jgi:hypothetical protein